MARIANERASEATIRSKDRDLFPEGQCNTGRLRRPLSPMPVPVAALDADERGNDNREEPELLVDERCTLAKLPP